MRIAWDDPSSVGKGEISRQGESRLPRESLRGDTGAKINESEPGRGVSGDRVG